MLGVLERSEEAAAWLQSQPNVAAVKLSGERISFQFTGSARDQAGLVTGLVQNGFLVQVLEEQKSSFEEILLDLASADPLRAGPTPLPTP